MVETKTLLQVKVLSAKLAKQIEVVDLDWNTGSKHNEIFVELKLVNDGGRAKVLGWAFGQSILEAAKHSVYQHKWWLVQYKGQLFWFMPPGEESDNLVATLNWPGLEQLFIG